MRKHYLKIMLAMVLLHAPVAAEEKAVSPQTPDTSRPVFAYPNDSYGKFIVYLNRMEYDFHLLEYSYEKLKGENPKFEIKKQLSLGRKPRRVYLSTDIIYRFMTPSGGTVIKRNYNTILLDEENEKNWGLEVIFDRVNNSNTVPRDESFWVVDENTGIVKAFARYGPNGVLLEAMELIELKRGIEEKEEKKKKEKANIRLIDLNDKLYMWTYLKPFPFPDKCQQVIMEGRFY